MESTQTGQAIRGYIDTVQKEYATGRATEHSYRTAMQALIESQRANIAAINEPKRVACGAPDFVVNRKGLPIGFVECKDVDEDLKKSEKTDQIKRYLGSLSNFILTNYLEFRYYQDGDLKLTVHLAEADQKGKLKVLPNAEKDIQALLGVFLDNKWEIHTPKELAHYMAHVAKLIRETITRALQAEGREGKLHDQFEAFRKVLLHDLTPAQFADMYAQTVCYGLFAARCNVAEKDVSKFDRRSAAWDIPRTNPFLRTMFDQMAGPDLDESITWAVDHLIALLRDADVPLILRDFGKATKREDPVVHFYETFLAEYDPKMREARGVYYTPGPVVSYIVRGVDQILKTDFGLKDGLADNTLIDWEVTDPKTGKKEIKRVHKVQILDPATGTGTFLHAVIQHIYERFESEGRKGQWSGYVREHLLPRLFGFELLMAPYAVAHMKLGLLLQQTGYDFASDERLNVFLTNTLEEAMFHSDVLFERIIADEANEASRVKKDVPVMVILGNPPYSGHSANKSWQYVTFRKKNGAHQRKKVRTFIGDLMQDYYKVDGKPLGERNPKWLDDDYVKFIRFAQWRIERTGHGVLGFITNHGYLDNPTFRGMRQSLLDSFDTIYVLDLHGNTKRKEAAPDGSRDENVFDIQQGVAIGIMVKIREE